MIAYHLTRIGCALLCLLAFPLLLAYPIMGFRGIWKALKLEWRAVVYLVKAGWWCFRTAFGQPVAGAVARRGASRQAELELRAAYPVWQPYRRTRRHALARAGLRFALARPGPRYYRVDVRQIRRLERELLDSVEQDLTYLPEPTDPTEPLHQLANESGLELSMDREMKRFGLPDMVPVWASGNGIRWYRSTKSGHLYWVERS